MTTTVFVAAVAYGGTAWAERARQEGEACVVGEKFAVLSRCNCELHCCKLARPHYRAALGTRLRCPFRRQRSDSFCTLRC